MARTKAKFEQRVKAATSVEEQKLATAAIARIMEKIKEAREDPIAFIEFVMRDPQGNTLVLKDWQKEVILSFKNESNTIVQAPRSHGKSSLMIGFLLWAIGCNPNIRIKLFCQNDKRAKERLFEIKSNLENNPAFKLVFPELKPSVGGEWSKSAIIVERDRDLKDATVEALGIETSATGGRCILPGTFILGAQAGKNIEDIVVNDRVLSSDGKFHKVLATTSKEFTGDAYVIKPEGFATFKTTPEHLILTCATDHLGFHSQWKRADALTKNDFLVMPRSKTGSSHKLFHNNEKQSKAEALFSDPFTWFVLGFYLVDGWACDPQGVGGHGNKKNTIGLALNRVTDADLVEPFKEWTTRHGGTSWSSERDEVLSFYITHPMLADLCRLIGNGSHTKRIPYWIERATHVHQQEFLKGYWRADGSEIQQAQPNGISYSSCNKELLYQIQQMWVTQGVIFHFQQTRDAGVGIIQGREINQTEGYALNTTDPKAHEILGLNQQRTRSFDLLQRTIIGHDHVLIPIRSIKTEKYSGLVYDIQVEGTHNFCAPGVTLHNCEIIVLDDVCDLRSSVVYPTLRDKIITKFMGELFPMLDPGGKTIAIATPWARQDLTAVLAANSEFKSLIFRVGNDVDKFAPLWPERWPREELVKLRATQGPIEFDRAYRCIAYSADAVPCKPEWIHFYNKEILGDPHKLICIQAYDLAIGEKDNADYFAGVTILYNQERNIAFVADAFHDHLSFSSQAQRIVDNYIRWSADRVIIERVGLGGGLENFLREKSPVQLPLVAYKPKGDKQRRFMEASPWLEDGHVYFHPNLDPQRNVLIDNNGDIITEMLEFPIGRHDDLVDAFVEAIWGCEEFKLQTMDEGWLDGGAVRARMTTVG